ncbi:fused response regulator/phosphatase [Nocardioides sp. Kera G14]|uniref:fused response regulator/phosphatase n=1 Tax=Nocardioides sp. Kera G14 TaxID=2884264 RepID=UPI001D10EC44|nr:fused response regulator/phosphatase [Nocardioides sp. Kera G14]UDY23644.1 fused response regulator/phosphatase [Nocardioides sp. Kera G14]
MPDRLPLVLVCDDTPAKRYVLGSWLRRSGYRVIEADTVAGALRVLSEQPVDLAVLDVHLPDGSGLDITRTLRADPSRASLPVVHVSAVAMETLDRVAGLDVGADAYLVDPVDPQELLSTIRTLLRSSGARRDAEELAGRLSALNRAAVRLSVAATVARLTEAVARAAGEVFDGPAVAVLADEQSAMRSAASPGGGDVTTTPLDERDFGLLDLLTSEGTVRLDDDSWRRVLPGPSTAQWRVWPMQRAGSRCGFVAVPVSEMQANDDFLLERLSQFTVVALENLETLAREHQTAMMLQRSLLPIVLPRPDGLEIAARYRASQQHAEVGGDFFDAFEVEDGLMVVIGDVQGHSLEAAVVMAELRYSLRAYAYDGYGPAALADRLNRVLLRNDPEVIATSCIGLIAPDRSSIRIVNAGHPTPILVRRGAASFVGGHGRLLGFLSEPPYADQVVPLEPGDRLLLMTDGLIERREEDLDVSFGRVAEAAASAADLPVEAAADDLLRGFGTSDDDVALVVVDVLGS